MPRIKPLRELPPQGDVGPQTDAQLAGAEIFTYRADSGARFRIKRRRHILEIMYEGGKLTFRQCRAGMALHGRYCKTQLSAESAFSRVFVDASPRPGDAAVKQAERVADLAKLSRHIPKGMREVVWHVAVLGQPLRRGFSRDGKEASMHSAMLKVALDLLANALGM